MASRYERYHHNLWHNVRENWDKLSNTTKEGITKLGWAPPRIGRKWVNNTSSPIPENGSGEDFLYMHRVMIQKANKILADNKEPYYKKIQGWKNIPAPGDKNFPVPPPYTTPNNSGLTDYTNVRKTDDYYYESIKSMEQELKDPKLIRNMTLSEYGSKIEMTVHSWMHMRWSANSSYGFRTSTKTISYPVPNIDKKWDNPAYDWMGDTYASHVNPVFWKLHGWVDDRIEDWRRAHNLTAIKWNNTWLGGPMSNIQAAQKKTSLRGSMNAHNMHDTNAVDDTMDKVLELLHADGIPESSFADNAQAELSFMNNKN